MLAFVISVAFVLLVISAVLTDSITDFFNTTAHPQTGWSPAVKAMWGLIILGVVIGIVVVILRHAGILHI